LLPRTSLAVVRVPEASRREALNLIAGGLIGVFPIGYFVTTVIGSTLVADWGRLPAQIFCLAVLLTGVAMFVLGCYRLVTGSLPPRSGRPRRGRQRA
jgi:hypothetical protein